MSNTSPFRPSHLLLVAALGLAASGCTSTGDYRAKVTPQRPTIGNTTETAAFGTVEIEGGISVDPSDRNSADATVRIGLSEDSELFVMHSPFVNVDTPGTNADGPGDLTIGYRQRLLEESRDFPATAIEFATSLPVGDDDPAISSGYTNFYAGITVDRHFGDLLTSWYYRLGAIGTPVAGDLNAQHTLAVSGYLPLMDRWSGVAELATIIDVESSVEPMFVNAAVMYEVTESLLFDVGVQLGLNDDAPDVVLFGGFTTNIGRVF